MRLFNEGPGAIHAGLILMSGRALRAALIAAGNVLLAATTEGELVVAQRNGAKIDIVKRYTVAESPIWAHPVPAGRGVLIKDMETLALWEF